VGLESKNQSFFEFVNRNRRDKNMVDNSITLINMTPEEGTMSRVSLREIFWFSDRVGNRCCTVIGSKKGDLIVGSAIHSVNEGFVDFAEIRFRIRDFEHER
jgi:hypothetical protein